MLKARKVHFFIYVYIILGNNPYNYFGYLTNALNSLLLISSLGIKQQLKLNIFENSHRDFKSGFAV